MRRRRCLGAQRLLLTNVLGKRLRVCCIGEEIWEKETPKSLFTPLCDEGKTLTAEFVQHG